MAGMPKEISQLNLRDTRHLAKIVGSSPKELRQVCGTIRRYYRIYPRKIGGKVREISEPIGRLREIQDRLVRYLQRIELPNAAHGGRKGRSILTNAKPHQARPVLLQTDIRDFFPSIRPRRVYQVLIREQGCSPDVAHILTRLVTINGSLPQGAPTSTIMAAIVTKNLTIRLDNLARSRRGQMTQYVDDVTLSGGRGIARARHKMESIIEQEGFVAHPDKTFVSTGLGERVVTGVRVDGGRGAPRCVIDETRLAVSNFESKVDRQESVSTQDLNQVRGKVNHLMRLEPGTAKPLQKRVEAAKSDAGL